MRPARRALAALALLGAAGGAGSAGAALQATAPAPRAARPNVVLILVDDLRYDALGADGHPFVETPNIDRLAREGVRFAHAYVTTSLCCPSRASLLTGAWAHRHGVTRDDGADLDPALATFPRLFQAAGWRTAFVGKWPMGTSAAPRAGFERWVSLEGQGVSFDPVLDEDGVGRTAQGYVTDLLTDEAVRWIGEQSSGHPFLLFLSHEATHATLAPAPRHLGRYAERPIPPPVAAADDLAGRPEALRRMAAFGCLWRELETNAARPAPERVEPPPWSAPEVVQAYLETVLAVDESVGRIRDALEQRGLLDDTVLLFTSDSGRLFGEHQAPDERLAYEESIHVPLLVRAPGRARSGAVVDELVLEVDLAPTLCELAGIGAPDLAQGRSFVPLLAGGSGAWREDFLYESFREPPYDGIPTTLALRGKDWKYVVYPDYAAPNEELYDLSADPHELLNLAESPEKQGRIAELRARLARVEQELGFALPAELAPLAFEPAPQQEVALDVVGASPGARPKVAWRADACFSLRLSLEAGHDEGAILSGGTPHSGFVLRLVQGRPEFELRSQGLARVARLERKITAERVQLEAGLDPDGRAFLVVDGGTPARSSLRLPAPLEPKETLLVVGGDAEAAPRIERLQVAWTGKRKGAP